MLTLVKLQDPLEKDIYSEFLVETNLSRSELKKEVENIVEKFENDGYDSWCYGDIVEELEKLDLIKTVTYRDYTVFV